jgi:hypothetical protein
VPLGTNFRLGLTTSAVVNQPSMSVIGNLTTTLTNWVALWSVKPTVSSADDVNGRRFVIP